MGADNFVSDVQALLAEFRDISLVAYAKDLETVRPALLALRIEKYKTLVEKREQARMPNYKPDPKDKETPRYTDFDRTTMLNAAVAEYEAEYELIRGLETLVAERIDLLKILLKG